MSSWILDAQARPFFSEIVAWIDNPQKGAECWEGDAPIDRLDEPSPSFCCGTSGKCEGDDGYGLFAVWSSTKIILSR